MSKQKYLHERTRTLRLLRTLRDNLDWEDAKEKRKLLGSLCPLFGDWRDCLPDISTIFDRAQIEHLIVASFAHYQGDRFIDFLIENGYRDKPDVGKAKASRVTPLLYSAKEWYTAGFWNYERRVLAPKLFKIYDRYEVNYRDEETGLSHFHVACMTGCHEVVAKFLERGAIVDVDYGQGLPETGDTPLHLAVRAQSLEVVELLLARGANPNAVNQDGLTPLLVASHNSLGLDALVTILDKVELGPMSPARRELRLDIQDEGGNTALHHALANGVWRMAELLLLCGANPNLANHQGATPLHVLVRNYLGASLARFFKLCDSLHQRLWVDARDKAGNTALHLAILQDHRPSIELLLARGADPNAVNRVGSTPMHLICAKPHDEQLAAFFLDRCCEQKKSVYINKKDLAGMTPLQLAVRNIQPGTCYLLLKSLSDDRLKGFRFPSEYRDIGPCFVGTRLKAAADLMWIKEMLAIRGCRPAYDDAWAMLEFLHRSGMFENGGYQREIERLRQLPELDPFVLWARETEPIPGGPSLWNTIQLRPGGERKQKRLEYWDYSRIARTWKLVDLWWEQQRACFGHMIECALRDFCREWAAECLRALSRHKLARDDVRRTTINDELANLDLYDICKTWELTPLK